MKIYICLYRLCQRPSICWYLLKVLVAVTLIGDILLLNINPSSTCLKGKVTTLGTQCGLFRTTGLARKGNSVQWAIAVYYKISVELLAYNIWRLCFLKCGMGGIRTHAPFSLKKCSLTEKAHCERALKSSTLSTTPRRRLTLMSVPVYVHVELRRDGPGWYRTLAFYNIYHNSPLRGDFLSEQDLLFGKCIGCIGGVTEILSHMSRHWRTLNIYTRIGWYIDRSTLQNQPAGIVTLPLLNYLWFSRFLCWKHRFEIRKFIYPLKNGSRKHMRRILLWSQNDTISGFPPICNVRLFALLCHAFSIFKIPRQVFKFILQRHFLRRGGWNLCYYKIGTLLVHKIGRTWEVVTFSCAQENNLLMKCQKCQNGRHGFPVE